MSFVVNHTYEILTPYGFKDFAGIQRIRKPTLCIRGRNGVLIEGSETHRVLTPSGYVTLNTLQLGDTIVTTQGNVDVIEITPGKEQDLYDIVEIVHHEHAFYTNDVISHNCDFLGSANSLIAPWKLAQLSYKTPIEERGNLKIYKKPIYTNDEGPGHIYLITIDVGQGQEQDYSVAQVIDISQSPFSQVAIFRDNKIKPTQFAQVLRDLGRMYNNAFLFFEINAEGSAVADIVSMEFEYENLVYIFPHPKKGQQISSGHHKRARLGLRVTEATKRVGCTGLKSLIENDKLLIHDYETLREMTTFVAKMSKNGSHAKTYEAESGNHDDTMSALVLLGWLTLQSGFENYVGLSMRQLLTDGHEPITFDEPFLGILGDHERQTVIGTGPTGAEVIDDPDFWSETPIIEDDNNKNWLF